MKVIPQSPPETAGPDGEYRGFKIVLDDSLMLGQIELVSATHDTISWIEYPLTLGQALHEETEKPYRPLVHFHHHGHNSHSGGRITRGEQ